MFGSILILICSFLMSCGDISSSCGSFIKLEAPDNFLKSGSVAMGSGWYPITIVMLDVYMDNFSGLNVSQLEGGSVSNIESLDIGDINIGLNYTPDFISALEGEDGFDKAIDEIAGIAALYPVYQTIATTKDNEDINKIEDIVDKHIFLGPKDGGGPVAFWKMMAEYGKIGRAHV